MRGEGWGGEVLPTHINLRDINALCMHAHVYLNVTE